EGGQGTFLLSTNFDEVGGAILLPEVGRAYEIGGDGSGEVWLTERRLGSLVCWPGSLPDSSAAATSDPANSTQPIASGGVVPAINTKPGAKGVIYVDFDGEVVTDPAWNGGTTINAAPSGLNADQIREVIARVAEDYAPFDIAISTVRSDYDALPPGRRMRVIVTPTSAAAPGSGGVAMVGSWKSAGRWLSSTVPAWVFNSSVKAVAEGISHEAGHTFGLNHQGTLSAEYYSGHGGGLDVPTSWAPIMGNSYGRSLTQWSKGEYAQANNTEDALAMISGPSNGVGYRDIPSFGNLTFQGNTFTVEGLIRSSQEPNLFTFQSGNGPVSATLIPLNERYTDADLQLELRREDGTTVALSSPVEALGASVNVDSLPAGTYQWVVRAAGTGAKPPGGYTSGYSEYGSLGTYRLSGTVGNVVMLPEITSALTARAMKGQSFSYQVTASGGATIALGAGALPSGLGFDSGSATLSGVPSEAGEWSIPLVATNVVGSVTRTLVLRVDDLSLPIFSVLGTSASSIATSVVSPWTVVSVPLADGQTGLAAKSGPIRNWGLTTLRFEVPGQGFLGFWWRVSSEAGYDVVECRINGNLAVDADTGRPLSMSGESGWVKQRVRLPGTGSQQVDITYSKDMSRASGSDSAWIYGVEVGRPPLIRYNARSFPRNLMVRPGETSFALELQVEGATAYQWKREGVALVDGQVGQRVIRGATTSRLEMSGVSAGDSGAYSLEARNGTGVVQSFKSNVQVAGIPEITQQPVAPLGLKTGDTLLLTVGAAGPGPLYYLWSRDGARVQAGASPVYQVRSVGVRHAGRYSVLVLNRWGRVASAEVVVAVDGQTALSPFTR
ncbi:MAG: hypothetical protein RLZZ244_2285, partial [Verrucomicrobiota bacterium]